MSTLRVAMVSTVRDRCGIADYTRTLVEALQGEGIEVERFSIDAAERRVPGFVNDLARRINAAGADVVHLQHEFSFFGFVAPPLAPRPLRRLLGPTLPPTSWWFDLVRALPQPLVATCHELASPDPISRASHGMRLSVGAALVRETTRATFSLVDVAITHGPTRTAQLAELGVPRDQLRTIPMGVRRSVLPPRARARAHLGVDDRFVLLSLGFASPRKQLALQVEVMRSLPATALLVIAGGSSDDSYLSSIRRQVEFSGLSDRIQFAGYLDKKEAGHWWAAADCALVTPSSMGAGSMSINEAVGAGVPTVTLALPEARAIDERYNCLIFSRHPGDPNALGDTIISLMNDPSFYQARRDATSEVPRRWSVGSEARDTIGVYREVLSRGPGVRPRHWRRRAAGRVIGEALLGSR